MPDRDGVTRILVVGFMASGKSTIGRLVADRLGWGFIDFDAEIEQRTGSPVPEIFRQRGETEFRAYEAELTREVADLDHVVLAPGGGWITRPELLDYFGDETLVVWLRVSPEEAVRRARADLSKRPLLMGGDPIARARMLLREREPLYRMADVVVDVDGRSAQEIADEIAGMVD
ncbi:MAG TPA: shikimate kinase [Longimicrobiales bacterium]